MPPPAASSLLRACVDEAAAAGAARVSLVFADRLPAVDGCSIDSARHARLKPNPLPNPNASASPSPARDHTLSRNALDAAGLELDEASWLPKPGLARHMGVARWTRRAVDAE